RPRNQRARSPGPPEGPPGPWRAPWRRSPEDQPRRELGASEVRGAFMRVERAARRVLLVALLDEPRRHTGEHVVGDVEGEGVADFSDRDQRSRRWADVTTVGVPVVEAADVRHC